MMIEFRNWVMLLVSVIAFASCDSDAGEVMNNQIESVDTVSVEQVEPPVEVGSRFGESFPSQYILLEESSDATLAGLEGKIKEFYKDSELEVQTKLEGNLLVVNINGWEMYFEDRTGGTVSDEVAGLVAQYGNDSMDNEILLGCKRMIVMSQITDDYMEYFNETLYALHHVAEFTGVHICTPELGFSSDF